MKTALESTLHCLGHSILVLSKVNVLTLGQGLRINLFCVLVLDVSIPGFRIGNIRNIYGYIRQNHIGKLSSEVKSAVSVQVLSVTCSIIIKVTITAGSLQAISLAEILHSILLILIVS